MNQQTKSQIRWIRGICIVASLVLVGLSILPLVPQTNGLIPPPEAQTVILALTAVIVIWYTFQMWRMRLSAEDQVLESRDANSFYGYTSVHERLSSELSRRNRRFLYNSVFDSALCDVVRKLWGDGFLQGTGVQRTIDVSKVLSDVKADAGKLEEFTKELSRTQRVYDPHIDRNANVVPLDVAESVLLDFDIVAGPAFKDNRTVELPVQIYAVIIKNTAPHLIPFVAVEMALRGNPKYKEAYLWLLKHLDPLIEVPSLPSGDAQNPKKGE